MNIICPNGQHVYDSSVALIDAQILINAASSKNPGLVDTPHSVAPHRKYSHPKKVAIKIDDGDVIGCMCRLSELQARSSFFDNVQVIDLYDDGRNNSTVLIVHMLRDAAKSASITYYREGFDLPDNFPFSSFLRTGITVCIQTSGPYNSELISQDTIARLDNFMFSGGRLKIECANPTSRSEVMNFFFGLFCKDVPMLAYRAPTVQTRDDILLADPLQSMVSIYDECRGQIADRFCDFNSILQKMLFRYMYLSYDILDSYARFEEAFNPAIMFLDFEGNIYLSSKFLPHTICGSLKAHGREECRELPQELFFTGNKALRNNCRDCPILPLCFGGDPWAAEEQRDKDCLQKFIHYAPIWTYFMNGSVLRSSIWDIVEAGFKHQELYIQFINSDVYKTAVGKK